MSDLYNLEVKESFLNTINPKSRYMYRKVLEKVAISEKFYNKDVSSFIHEEYAELLHSLNARSLNSISTQHSIIRNYIQFAVDSGAASSRRLVDNVAAMFTSEDLKQFIRADARNNQIIDTEELDELVDFCYNEQDAALIQALREGIKGTSCSELINLKINDINIKNNTVKLYDKNSSRTMKISPKAIDLLMAAHRQEKYWRRNGESTSKKSIFFYLPETEYVFKSTGRNRLGRANSQILRRRLKAMADWYGNPFLNITNIWNSGAVEYGKQLLQEYGINKLELKHYKTICERYGINPARATSIRQSIDRYIHGD